jgi:hypothetical protein
MPMTTDEKRESSTTNIDALRALLKSDSLAARLLEAFSSVDGEDKVGAAVSGVLKARLAEVREKLKNASN